MSELYLQTKKLTVGYNGRPLINNIEINLDKGQILTLIGPNGSGKSTILKSLTKHLKKIGGTVFIEKESLDTMNNKELAKKVAVVLTDRMRTELLTCWDIVATGRYPYTGRMGVLSEQDNKKVKEAMKLVHATEFADKDFTSISDGQRQRIMLARAICQEPEIIVLDEPTSFLDIRHKLELLNILRKMSEKENITVVMSLHEIDLAQKVSDMVMCVKGDVIYDYGTPKKIFKEEKIKELYDINIGTYNMTFGSIELSRPEGEPKVFVVAGGGTGIQVYRELQKRNISFYTGVLHKNDIDYQVAKSLAQEIFLEEPFCEIKKETYNNALNTMLKCSYVFDTGVQIGEINKKNALLLKKADEANIKVIKNLEEIVSLKIK